MYAGVRQPGHNDGDSDGDSDGYNDGYLEDGNELARGVEHRDAEHGARLVSREHVDVGVKARVAVHVTVNVTVT